MAKPLYRARKRSFDRDRIIKAGEEFEFDGVPSRHWTPLNDEAKAQAEKIKPTGLAKLEKVRQEAREKREAEELKAAEAKKKATEDSDTGEGEGEEPNTEEGGEGTDETKVDPATLTPTQKAKAILDVLKTLNHNDDAHWTQGGDPDLNVLKEKLGFAVKRVDVKEVAPEFVREAQPAKEGE